MSNLKYPIILLIFLFFFNNAAVMAAQINQAAPEFSLPSLTIEDRVNVKDYRNKVVYLDFWASWCIPCQALI